MNYLKAYCNLIRKAEKRGYTKKKAKEQGLYVEGHHTFPKSIYGNNKRVVYLTAREHYVAHALLEKICIKRYGVNHWKTLKMVISHISFKGNKFSYQNSHIYENCKKRWSEIMKNNNPSKKGQSKETIEKRASKLKGRKHSEETKNKIRNSLLGIKHTERRKINSIRHRCKYLYEIINPDGEVFITENMKEFCVDKDLHPCLMIKVANGKYKQHKGWTAKIVSTLR